MIQRLFFLAILATPLVINADYAEEQARRRQNQDLRLQEQNRELQAEDLRRQERSVERQDRERRIEEQNDAEIRRDQLEFERLK